MAPRGLQAMRHEVDPRAALEAEIGHFEMALGPCRVLAAIYQRPKQTAGGIIVPDKTRGEDVFQGKIALLLRFGPLCFMDSPSYSFGGFEPRLGDWVTYRIQDGLHIKVNGVDCRILRDTEVQAVVGHPDTVF